MMPSTEVSTQMERMLLLSREGRTVTQHTPISSSIWCKLCCSHVEPITNYEAEVLTRVCSRAILRQIEEGSVHYMETSDGLQLVCPNSL